MLNVKINIESIDINEFINYCISIISQNLHSDSIVKFLSPTLKLLSLFKNTVNSTFFLMNNQTFKFEFTDSTSDMERNKIVNIFDDFIEKGYIGEAIDKENLITACRKEANGSNSDFIILPIIKFNGILGIFLIQFNGDDIFDSLTIKYNMFAKIFSSQLEIFLLHNENRNILSILEQKVAVRTLNLINSKRELEIVLNAVQTAIIVIEPKSNIIIHANPEAIRLIGGNEKNIINEIPYLFLERINYDKQVIFSRNFQSYLINLNQEKVPILRSTSKIKYEEEYIIIENFVDITNIKEFEKKLRLANDQLEQKVQERTEDLKNLVNQLEVEVVERKKAETEIKILLEKEKEVNDLKSRFITLMSHEFRTPLTIINNSAQIVQNYKDKLSDDDQKQYMNRIQKTVQQLSSFLDNVLFFSKSDTLGFENNLKNVNIVKFTEAVINDVKLSSEKNHELNYKFNMTNEEVFIDEKLYRYILINLLSNAFKYSDEKKPINVNLSSENNQIILSVEDYGIGIPDAEKDKIFDQFYRADNIENIPGTGLGLSVVSSSLKIMGGKIDVESQVNIGTTFTITIPNNHEKIL